MTLNEFIDSFFKSHPQRAYEAAHAAQPMPKPFPSGLCANCNRPLDDHVQGRCPK